MIRDLLPGDAPELHQIMQAVCAQQDAAFGGAWKLSQVEEACAHGGRLIEVEGRIGAFVFLRPIPDGFEVDYLATAPVAQRQGAMVLLLGDIFTRLQAGECIWLEVHERNERARALYLKVGFQETGKRPRYYADQGAAILYTYVATYV